MIIVERTLTAEAETVTRLEALAVQTGRPVSELATEALRIYLEQEKQSVLRVTDAFVATRPEDLALGNWPEADTNAFLRHLGDERQESLRNDAEQQRY